MHWIQELQELNFLLLMEGCFSETPKKYSDKNELIGKWIDSESVYSL